MTKIIKNISALTELIHNSNKILLVGHVNPDGDCIGALSGMKEFLKEENKKVMISVPNKYPDFFKFLDVSNEILNYIEHKKQIIKYLKDIDLIICMDFNSLKRIDDLGDLISQSNVKKVLIDHHLQPDKIFDLSYSYPELSSTCELTYWIIKNILNEKNKQITYNIAVPLYVGLVTDTNNFANSVLSSTFRMASEILDIGVNKEWIQEMVFSSYTEQRARFMGYMLLKNMKLIPEYNAAIMVLTKKLKNKFDYKDGDSEGFVNLALNIKDVKISALFTETDEFVKVSLRSKDGISVNKLSRKFFNGGGHERAAGGKIFIPIKKVEDYYLESLREFIGN